MAQPLRGLAQLLDVVAAGSHPEPDRAGGGRGGDPGHRARDGDGDVCQLHLGEEGERRHRRGEQRGAVAAPRGDGVDRHHHRQSPGRRVVERALGEHRGDLDAEHRHRPAAPPRQREGGEQRLGDEPLPVQRPAVLDPVLGEQAAADEDGEEDREAGVHDAFGRPRYILPHVARRADPDEVLNGMLGQFGRSVAPAGNIVVVQSELGSAPAIARALDQLGHDRIVGTLAGDDTVLVVAASERDARSLARELGSLVG